MDDAAPDATWCRWCGRRDEECLERGGHPGDPGAILDPPRFCPTCRRRLRVLVTPTGWQAACRDHGPVRAVP